jgi:hypothetical protein
MSEVKQELGSDLTVTEHSGEREKVPHQIILYSHSTIYYWWPVWFFGFIMAGLTWFFGEQIEIPNARPALIYPNYLLGLIYVVILFLVFLFTNVSMRGLVSGIAILVVAFVAVLLAWWDLWDNILFMIPDITVYMNLGFYLFISVTMFITWMVTFFITDRLEYWRVRPGQVTHERVIGGAEKSFDTIGMVFEEQPQDLFKHYLLGLGSSDLKVAFRGARQEEYYLPNVLFAHRKVNKIQALVKRKPK